jgi:DUF1680 family protein
MLGFVSSSELRDQAVRLVSAFAQEAVPAKGRSKVSTEALANRALQSLFDGVAEYCRARKLGVIGRARLAKALQAELQSRQFSDDTVAKVTSAVAINSLVRSGKT